MTGRPHANFPTGAFGGAPYGATKRVRGVTKDDDEDEKGAEARGDGRRRKRGEGGREGRRKETRGDAYSKRGPNTTGWLGHTCEACAEMGGATPCGRTH